MIKIDLKSLDKATKQMIAEIEKAATSELAEVVAKEADEAREKFQHAHYDGVNDVTVSDPVIKDGEVSVVFKGNALPYIEWGTGVYRDPSFMSEQTFDTIWYFTSHDPKTQGNKATYERGGYYKTTSSRGKERRHWNLSKNLRNQEEAELFFGATSTSGLEGKSEKKRKGPTVEWVPRETVPKKNSYISSGNSPQYIMTDMKDNIDSQFTGK